MTNSKRPERPELDDDYLDHPPGWTKKSWDKYVKDHNRKLNRTKREADGSNMDYPPEKDYD